MPLSDILCKQPLCGEVEVEVADVELSNTEYHGGLFCHLIPESLVIDGIRKDIDTKVEKLRKKWPCEQSCACTSVKIGEFEIQQARHLHREHLWDASILNGNCRLTGDLSFTLKFRIHAGICHDPDLAALGEAMAEVQEALKRLRELGPKLERLLDPDEIWKRIGGVSPKALRESPSVEPPRRIHRRKSEQD